MNNWTWHGMRAKRRGVSFAALALALLAAFETFFTYQAGYDLFTNLLFIGVIFWAFFRAIRAKASLGLLFLPLGLLWFLPLFGSEIFDSIGLSHFLAHSLLSILFAVSGFTFLSRQHER